MTSSRPALDVLIIDDEEDFARALASRLELRNMTTRCAFDGEQGLTMLRESPPDLLLLDMRMPGLSGVDVLRRLRCGNIVPGGKTLPVCVISGHTSERDFLAAGELGIQGYLTKPLQFSELLEVIGTLDDKKR